MSTAQTRLEKNFKKFHEKNPAVWTEFKRYSFEAIESGRQHYSAQLIINKIRWDSGINTSRTNAFKVANATSHFLLTKGCLKPLSSRVMLNINLLRAANRRWLYESLCNGY